MQRLNGKKQIESYIQLAKPFERYTQVHSIDSGEGRYRTTSQEMYPPIKIQRQKEYDTTRRAGMSVFHQLNRNQSRRLDSSKDPPVTVLSHVHSKDHTSESKTNFDEPSIIQVDKVNLFKTDNVDFSNVEVQP